MAATAASAAAEGHDSSIKTSRQGDSAPSGAISYRRAAI